MAEIRTARSPNSKTYDLGSGRLRWSGGIANIHYLRHRQLVDIAPRLEPDPDGDGFSHRVRGHPLRARIKPDGTRRLHFRDANGVIMPTKWLQIGGIPGIGPPTARYAAFTHWQQPGFDLMINATGPMLQQFIVLRDKQLPTAWSFPLHLQGLHFDRSHLPWLIMDGKRAVAEFSRPRAVDAEGNERWLDVQLNRSTLSLHLDPRGLTYPLQVDPTVNLQVGASTDDAYSYSDDSAYNDDGTKVYLYSDDAASSRIHSGTRFLNVTIPNAATITTASWQPYVVYDTIDDMNCTLYCHDVDDSPTFAAANSPYDRITGSPALTTANVAWAEDSLGIGYAAHDMAAPVQELVNRVGWASGQALTVLGVGGTVANKYVRFYSFDNGSNACKLDIVYTTNGVTIPPIFHSYRQRRV